MLTQFHRAIVGTREHDVLQGNGTSHAIVGKQGNDTLLGWGATYNAQTGAYGEDHAKVAAEILNGGQGDDVLNGGAGNDVLNGGQGNDILIGGSGSDVFSFSVGNDVILDFTPSHYTKILDFEQLGSGTWLPLAGSGYAGLTWSLPPTVVEASAFGGGYQTALTSGTHVGVDGPYALGMPPYPEFSDPANDFDFVSGYFAAAWWPDMTFTVTAYDDGQAVGQAVLHLGNTVKTFVNFLEGTYTGAVSGAFSGRFTSIDSVRFEHAGGEDGSYVKYIAMDDLALRYSSNDQDKIKVADVTNVAALVASATSDGNGGTVLTGSNGSTLTLVGVDPSAVSQGWFI